MASEKKKFDQIKYQDEFNRKNYDNIFVRVPKGEKKIIQEAAKAERKSVNEFIVGCIRERLNKS